MPDKKTVYRDKKLDSKNYNINDFFIENADIKDINSIMFIEKTSFAKEITEDKKVFIERLETFPEGFFILRERQSNEAAGYITCEIWNRNNPASETVLTKEHFNLSHPIKKYHNPEGDCLYIASIAISKKYRGKGLGSLLLDLALDKISLDFPKINNYILLVNSLWENAISLYKRKGFKKSNLTFDTEPGILENFFEQNGVKSKGIIMEKTIVR